MIQVQDQTLRLENDVTIALRWFYDPESYKKNPDLPVIILLHEALGCIDMWKDFPSKLAEKTGLPVLAYDREGYGQSSPLRHERQPDYLQKYGQEELPQIVNILSIKKPILFGHSDGGSVAMYYAAKFDPLAIITEAGHVFVEKITEQGIKDALQIWETTNLKDKLARYHGDKTETIFMAWAKTWLSDPFLKWNMEEDTKSITCPTLILQGAEDEYGSIKQVDSIFNHVSGPKKSLILEDCRHIPHLQKMDVVLDATQDFLVQLPKE
ncbi:MAG: alpha/beta hydrolase [Alphaproteobacteria bacterium]|nr:alpha/beta hydrolase [Alphaproteobacteria bacterium]